MNNDQRLIPFLGGLAIGGIGGAAFNNNRYPYYGYNYYQPYYTPYPYTNNYYYPNTQVLPVNSNEYVQYDMYQTNVIAPGKLINENSYPLTFSNDERSIQGMSNVPPYSPYL